MEPPTVVEQDSPPQTVTEQDPRPETATDQDRQLQTDPGQESGSQTAADKESRFSLLSKFFLGVKDQESRLETFRTMLAELERLAGVVDWDQPQGSTAAYHLNFKALQLK